MAIMMSPPMVMVVPSICAFCVPAFNPAWSAGPPLVMPVSRKPYVMLMFMALAM